MIKINELLERIRPITEKDKSLLRYSYSKLEVFKNCPLQYRYKYIDKKRTEDTSIALELGSLCHKILEMKGEMVAQKQTVDYDLLQNILFDGTSDKDEKILGVKQLRKKYFDKWHEPDNASGLSYEEKMKVFDTTLHEEMEDNKWTPIYFEMPFEFVWSDRAVFHGFIDRIDINETDYRSIDYKTSKKKYDDSKLATSLQFGIYALAILNTFGVLPRESAYRFILINETQFALTKGWEKRLIKAIDKVLNEVEACKGKNVFVPKPTPLCHWCNFCRTNSEATTYKNECEYFSKWMPDNKTFDVNKKYNALENVENQNKRKLVF